MPFVNNEKKNKGAGLISVIIAIAFVAILGSIIMSITMTNYKMKQTNLKTQESFYTAEQALDEVRVGLQGVISQAVSTSYLQVMENYSAYDLKTKKDLMESVFFETIWQNLAENPSTHTTYDISKLTAYLVNTTWAGGDLANGYGAILSSDSNQMITYDDEGVVLKNLKVYFRDERGYVSMITTDIKLVIPDLQFTSSTNLTDLSQYCIIADTGLITAVSGSSKISGSIYAGSLSMPGSSAMANTTGRLSLNFPDEYNLIVKNGIKVQNADLNVANSTLWANDIVGESSNLTLGSSTNLNNDLMLSGSKTSVIINGNYNGYGNHLTDADQSSSIIINGKDATLNLASTTALTLAGHAFIGTKSYNVGSATGTVTGVGSDIYTGESISVKSNQLIYLVPAECIGVSYTTAGGGKVVGKSVYGRNPLVASSSGVSVSPYEELAAHPELYDMISDSVVSEKLGHPLSEYLNYINGVPQVDKVFVQTNGETLVYFYMTFKDENAANQYFQDYYSVNSEQISRYADFYTNGITMNNPAFMLRLQLAGNVMKYSGATASVQENTVDNGSAKLAASSLNCENTFKALCTRLIFQYSELTNLHATDLTKNIVFDNMVDMSSVSAFMTQYNSYCVGIPKTYTFGTGSSKALLTDNASTTPYHYTGNLDKDVHLIIATGDVSVDSNFSGLILANGTVTLGAGVTVTANADQVREATEISQTIDGTNWNVIGFLWDGSELLNAMGNVNGEENSVDISNLVIYENWTKN